MRSPRAAKLASVSLGALLVFCAAGPAQAGSCPAGYHFNDFGNGAGFCAQDAIGGGTGGPTVSYGGGSGNTPSYGEPMAPPAVKQPSTPVYVPAPVQAPPAAPRPAPYVAPKAPAQQAPAYVAPAQVNVPAAPVQAPNQPVKGFAPAENPVIAGVPAEAPAAQATPAETPSVTPSATASAAPSASLSQSETPGAEPIQSERAASTTSPAPFIAGLLALLVVGAAAWQWRRTRQAKAG